MARAGFGPAAQPPLDIVIKEESSLTVVRSGLVDLTDPKCPFHGLQDGLFHPSVARPRFIATGGAGFIGSHLVKKLRETYPAEQIKVVDNLWRGHLRNLQYEDGSWAISPIRDFCQV